MIPSIEYAFGDYAIVPGIAIGSRGPVRSVSLYHRGPLDRGAAGGPRHLEPHERGPREGAPARDAGPRPRVRRHGAARLPRMLDAADAALVIGDPALYFESEVPRLDLARSGSARTGLPFVYAFWAGPRRGARGRTTWRASSERCGAGSRGGGPDRARLQWPAARAMTRGERRPTCGRTSSIRLGDEEQRGLAEFYRRAHALGLIPRLPELRFHGQSLRRSRRKSEPGSGSPATRVALAARRRPARARACSPTPCASGCTPSRSSPTSSTATSTTRTSARRSARSARSTATCPRRRATSSPRPSSRQKIDETLALGRTADPAAGRPAPGPRDRVLRGAVPLDEGDLARALDPRPVARGGEAHREGLEPHHRGDAAAAHRRGPRLDPRRRRRGPLRPRAPRHRHREGDDRRTGSRSWRRPTAWACGRRPP